MFEQKSAREVLKYSPVIGVMTNSLDMNAFAMMLHLGEKFLISVNAGVVLRVTVSAYRLAGFQDGELGKNVVNASSRFSPGQDFPLPVDPERRKRALRCAMYATVAIFCHEIAHCFRGHLGKSKMRLNEEFLGSAGEVGRAADEVRSAMEFDADEFSGRFLTDIFFQKQKERGDLLHDADRVAEFESIAAGVLIALCLTRKSSIYLSGVTRAFVILIGVLTSCASAGTRDGQRPMKYLNDLLERLQAEMTAAGVEMNDSGVTMLDEKEELKRNMDVRDEAVASWLSNRPDWGGRGKPEQE